MKFSMNRLAFLSELTIVQRAISTKTTMPILSGLKIHLNQQGMTLTGSNAEISIEKYLPYSNDKFQLTIEEQGMTVVPAKVFNDIIKKLPEEHFYFELLDNQQIKISSGKAEFLIHSFDADHYPQLPLIQDREQLILSAGTLNQLIQETVFATSTQESRPILTGVHLVLKENYLKAVATDSHRLSQRILTLPSQPHEFDVVIPNKSLLELSRSLTENEEQVEIVIVENQILFKTSTMHFYSRLLEGFYPDTDRLIPTESAVQLKVYGPDLLAAVERASLLSHEGKHAIVRLNIQDQHVILHGKTPDIGMVEEELIVQEKSGDHLEISFNPEYMKAALRAFGATHIYLNFIGPLRAFTLKPEENEDYFIQLITPIRTSV